MAARPKLVVFEVEKERYDRLQYPELKKKEIGFFSTDAGNHFYDTDQELRYFNPENFDYRNVAFDLNQGLDVLSREDKSLKLEYILQWMNKHKDRFVRTYMLLF